MNLTQQIFLYFSINIKINIFSSLKLYEEVHQHPIYSFVDERAIEKVHFQ